MEFWRPFEEFENIKLQCLKRKNNKKDDNYDDQDNNNMLLMSQI